MRNELSNELSDVVNEFGPKLYDDFDKVGQAYNPLGSELHLNPSSEFLFHRLLCHLQVLALGYGEGNRILEPLMRKVIY
jgi:hypothetical protein